MRSYRIVLEYTTTESWGNPEKWDWHDLVAQSPGETVSLIEVEEIEVPDGHIEDLEENE